MATPGSSSSVFSSLPARPPTPPRDISNEADDALRFLQEGHQKSDAPTQGTSTARPLPSTDTPPQRSPTSSQSRGSNNAKKVDFSPWPTYHKIPHLGQSSSPQTRALRQTPLSRAAKPLKSILKPAADRLPPTPDELSDSKLSYFSPQEPGSFRKMLQSVLHQLESTSRDARRDAYLALNGALKAYEGVPEPQAIVEKIKPLMQFITRDMAWKDETGRLETNVVTQALTLTCAIMYNPHTAHALDDDFRSFLVDRSIFVMEQADMPKAIIKSHMFLLCQQRFSTSVLTVARAEKLITTLQTVESRCSGNSVYSARMVIYSRLIEQAAGTMLSRMRDWIEHVFHGVLSTSKDLRTRAIEACTAAALILGHHQQASKVLYEVCEKEAEDGASYGDYLNLRLMKMTGDKEVAEFVPQIWSAIIMFFRCKRKPVEKWPKFRTWLFTIQKSLNSGDLNVKRQANIAWNRLVFSVMPDSTTTETMRSMLRVPIEKALEKKGNDKHSQQLRQFALDSYCNLLHYALRPELSHEELDLAWDMYVAPLLALMAKSSSRGQLNACRILHGLFKRGGGQWNVNAVNESEAIKPEELPGLDPRWLRSRLGKVINVLEPIIVAGMQKSPKYIEQIDCSWKFLLQAVAEAGSQEVKMSNELKEAIAQLTNLFRRTWTSSNQLSAERDSSFWFSRYQTLLQIAVDAIGAGHFVEDVLHKTTTDDVEAAPTPLHRPSKHHAPTHSSFVFLFALYCQPPSSLLIDNNYQEPITWFLRLLSGAKGSSSGVLALLHRANHFASQPHADKDTCEAAGLVWIAVADLALELVQKSLSKTLQHDTIVVGVILRSALNILVDGLATVSDSLACIEKALELYSAYCKCAKYHAGDGGVVLGVMEPLSVSLLEKAENIPFSSLMRITVEMLKRGVWPKNRQELDHSRKKLWAVSLELSKGSTFDPFDGVYKLLDHVFEDAYRELANPREGGSQLYHDCFTLLTEFLRRCPLPILPTVLRKIQRSLSTWILDTDRFVFLLVQPTTDKLSPHAIDSSVIVEFWSSILQLIGKIPRKDTPLLQSLEKLLVAGFSSPSKTVVNSTISFWNESFGNETLLIYPPTLQSVLRARRAQTELSLPGFPEDFSDMDIAILPAFEESQCPPAVPAFAFAPAPRTTKQSKRLQSAENTLIKQHLAANDLPYDAVAVMGSSSASSTPAKAKSGSRLRHQDSQIAFAPIDSSCPSNAFEESQLLTERQRDVKERQRGDAQMFPDLSSSPVPKSTASKNRLAKKLDFTSDPEPSENEDLNVTPTGPSDGNLMSDDLPSSPTPRASAATRGADEADGVDEDAYETDCDPPSSPPKQEKNAIHTRLQRDQEKTTESDIDCTTVVSEDANDEMHDNRSNQDASHKRSLPVGASDPPSDTMLPTAQLQREAAAAESEAAMAKSPVVVEETVIEADLPKDSQRTPQTPSRIENTTLEDGTTRTTNTNTPRSLHGSKKRKRTSETVFASKKRKQSPFKTFFSGLLGRSQEADDEIDDEIVVAGSQGHDEPSLSPQQDDVAIEEDTSSQIYSTSGKTWSPQVLVSPPAQAAVEGIHSQETRDIAVNEPEVTRKRGRGRPKKKSHNRGSSSGPPPAVAGIKRSASALDAASTDSHHTSSTSRIEDTPAPPQTRKQRRAENAAQDASRSASQNESQATSGTSANSEQGDQQPAANANRGRKIAKPTSLIGKLKGALAECKKMILGTDEDERAIDDLMFEIRREVFEARRRGKA